MKKLSLFFFLVISIDLLSDLKKDLDKVLDPLMDKVIDWRHDIHQNPELSNREYRTSKKVENGEYSEKKVITSFIGVFPIDNPNFLTFVLFDEPQRNTGLSLESFGSNTAAPTFSKIVSKISPILIQNNYFKYLHNENK